MFTNVLDKPAVSIFMADEVLSPSPGMNSPFSYILTILIPEDHNTCHSKNFKSHIKTTVLKWASDHRPSSHGAQTMTLFLTENKVIYVTVP
jgi:hypothetical protein